MPAKPRKSPATTEGAARPLTPKQLRFVQEYIKDHNATRAAVRAGYSPTRADAIGWENLRKPEIAEAVDAARKIAAEKAEVDVAYVLRGLRNVAERCMQEVKPVLTRRGDHVNDEDGNLVYTFNASGATRAYELLGKHLGMFVELTNALPSDVTAADPDAAAAALKAASEVADRKEREAREGTP